MFYTVRQKVNPWLWFMLEQISTFIPLLFSLSVPITSPSTANFPPLSMATSPQPRMELMFTRYLSHDKHEYMCNPRSREVLKKKSIQGHKANLYLSDFKAHSSHCVTSNKIVGYQLIKNYYTFQEKMHITSSWDQNDARKLAKWRQKYVRYVVSDI